MTRFEEASESPVAMSVMVAFCIAAYLRQLGYTKLKDDAELSKFMNYTSDDIRKWLLEETQSGNKREKEGV